jgi:hypothetical protein
LEINMHRPNRLRSAALAAFVVGVLGATQHVKEIFRPVAGSRRNRRGVQYPHHNDREKLRRRTGGFSKLHDHTVRYVGEPYLRAERYCPICDQGLSHAEAVKLREAA